MTEKQKEALKYKDYPEGSGGKSIYDLYFMEFEQYLEKYYRDPEYKQWERWYNKYIEPAFDPNRHSEMIKNFGYISDSIHDFTAQSEVFNDLKSDARLTEEIRQFIGFMAGSGFFKRYNLSLNEWFNMKNWSNPYTKDIENGMSINEILNCKYGINYFKISLTQMPHWNR
ncbi:MAG: hypothetical protein KA163_02370 [Bacteroidia bacterium]|nr:hypothetical protein [Bacteroidia bacterium]